MSLQERIDLLVQLGNHLRGEDEYLAALIHRTAYNNPWFTIENQQRAVKAVAQHYLQREQLEKWLSRYKPAEDRPVKTVGLVLAGNIPLVGFHDVLCVFAAGHRAMIKLSDKDKFVLPYLLKLLGQFDERAAGHFQVVEKLEGFDAVIATGSNNSARYFEAYFGKYPHIIRRNRNGIAVLTGEESEEELKALGKDVFQYFGLGCRNVAKLYVPEDYDFEPLLHALHEYRDIVQHNKYKNNFDYNFATHVLNKTEYKNNGCILLTENRSIHSRIGELYYETYRDKKALVKEVQARREEIQCIVAKEEAVDVKTFPFGKAQEPELWDYADEVDTMDFLLSL